MWWARRGVIVLMVIVLVDVSIEATLATMRRRDVVLSIAINNPAATPTVTPNVQAAGTPQPTATPVPEKFTLKPSDRLTLSVQWNYHIGPRFPSTVIHAEALIDDRNIAEGQVSIDCGAAIIDCIGTSEIQLAYTIPASGTTAAQSIDWPVGNYNVIVDRSDGGLNPVTIKQYQFNVAGS